MILNAFPYNNGHVMVSPFKHVPSIEGLEPDELTELMTLAQRAIAALREVYRPEGFNIGINQGKVAGAGVEDHVHLHVVPPETPHRFRNSGDAPLRQVSIHPSGEVQETWLEE